jgi:hypothetical protein
MSDRPDFTANTALNAVADTLDNLPVSINAQQLGSLAVDIAAQSAGEVDINLSTNSAGDIDISIQDQSGGVETGTEFAAIQGNTVQGSQRIATVGSGGTVAQLFDNTTGNPVVVEFISGAQTDGFVEAVRVDFRLKDAAGSLIAEFSVNPVNLPLSFDPGIRVPSGGTVNAFFDNNATTGATYKLELVSRELV